MVSPGTELWATALFNKLKNQYAALFFVSSFSEKNETNAVSIFDAICLDKKYKKRPEAAFY